MKKYFLSALLWLFSTTTIYAQWQNVGTEGFSAGIARNPVLSTAPDGTPYVAYTDLSYTGKLSVMRYVGGSWQYVGAAGFTTDSASYPSVTIDGNGIPYVCFRDKSTGGKLTVMKYISSGWSTVGMAGFVLPGSSAQITAAIIKCSSSGVPFIAFNTYTTMNVYQFNGSAWTALPVVNVAEIYAFGFEINKVTNEPLIVYNEEPFTSYNGRASVQKYSSGVWSYVGNRAFSSSISNSSYGGGVYYASIGTDAGGNIYVGLQDDDGREKAAVYKLNGSTWVSVGPKFISAGHTYNEKIVLSASGVPYILYSDLNNSSRPTYNSTVLRYNNSVWQAVGPAGFLREYTISDIAIAADGFPYVLNTTAAGKAKVVKYVDNPMPAIKPTSQYTFLTGDSAYPFMMKTAGIGVASASNTPGGRYYHALARNNTRTMMWVFGGYGHNTTYPNGELLNDLWQYQASTNSWTQMGATRTDIKGVYGVKGTASATNVPGQRYGHVMWSDPSDNVWLFGGYGYDASGTGGYLNDLWKYNVMTNQWAWISGDSNVNKTATYGAIGLGTTSTKPGSRYAMGSCTDISGNLLLFGGNGYGSTSQGYLGDLWRYNISMNQWTWVSGDSTINPLQVLGTQGVASSSNKPGYKGWPIMSADANNTIWLFSGQYATGITNLIWRYQPTSGLWTWMKGNNETYGVYGNRGVAATTNTPGQRQFTSGDIDASNNIWILGGYGNGVYESQFQSTGTLNLNDLWKYNTVANTWTWVSGDSTMFQHGIYGIQGIASSNNKSGGELYSASVILGNDFYNFGGEGFTKSGGLDYTNTLLRYSSNTSSWTWLKGNNYSYSGYSGLSGIGSVENRPSARSGHTTLRGNDGSLYLFGGNSAGGNIVGTGLMNDIWKYTPSTNIWTFLKGAISVNSSGNFGIQGTTVTSNQPSARQNSASWKDINGNIWIFGGITSTNGYLSDLWRYDVNTNNWTWVKGSNLFFQAGVYGTTGTAAPTNQPGCRFGTYTWTDTSGNLWLYGGFGKGSSDFGILSDLWKYNIATNFWTFIKGDSVPNRFGTYGDTLDFITNNNRPGSRQQGASWVDNAGNLCLFGGAGYSAATSGYLADVWKYNIATGVWTWMRGSKNSDATGTYGTAGIYAALNNPGGRFSPAFSADQYGNLILLSGYGLTATGSYDFMNDLWKYDNASNNWAYMKGQSGYGPTGIYSRQAGTASATASIGGRYLAGLWADNTAGKVYLYGGLGYTSNAADGYNAIENDLWKLDEELVTLPLKIIRFTARPTREDVLCSWVTTEEFSLSHFEVERSLNGSDFIKIGTVGAANSYTNYSYSFTDAGATKLNSSILYYRLKSVDKDGKHVYSGIVVVRLSLSPGLPVATLYPNPIQKISYLSIEAGSTQTVSIKIINASGQQLLTRQINLAIGTNSVPIDCSSLPTGTYLLQISGADVHYAPIRFAKTGI